MSESTALAVTRRESANSRANRRLRREGVVLGVVYGGGEEPVPFCADARVLRGALQTTGAVLELSIDGDKSTPVILKQHHRHPVTGHSVHVDFMRVRMDQPIEATVPVVLINAEDAPGVTEGGILEGAIRELTISALPANIPDEITLDVAGMQIGDSLPVSALKVPEGVTIHAEPDQTVATITVSRAARAEEGLEEETELVGEGAEGEGGEAAEGGDDAAEESGGE